MRERVITVEIASDLAAIYSPSTHEAPQTYNNNNKRQYRDPNIYGGRGDRLCAGPVSNIKTSYITMSYAQVAVFDGTLGESVLQP